MRTKLITFLAILIVTFSSCMKHASDYVPGYGEKLNTWTFTDGKNWYYGNFPAGAVLHTTPQSNNTYTLDMTGTERATGEILTLAISLLQPELDNNSYLSGISNSDHATAFYYSGSTASRDAIYTSNNANPGAMMNFTIMHYDNERKFATIGFHGQAYDASGNLVNIAKGRLTASVEHQ